MNRQRLCPIVLLALLCLAALAGCSLLGATHLNWHELWQSEIFWHLRLPRELLSLLVGGVLAACGTAYQAVFRNPLTDPYLLGVSSGASLGAAIAILLGLESYIYGVGLCALASALLTVAIIYRMASTGNRLHTTTLLLTGVCLTLLISAAVSFLMVMNHDKMDRIIFWTMGSFASSNWTDIVVMTPVTLIGLSILLYHGRNLNLLLSGSDTARSMGVEVERVQKTILAITSVMVAFAVSVCGVIGFVGLIVPHAVRLVAGADNRKILPLAVLSGGLFMLLCDTLARTLFQPSELPVGSLTALLGAPLFITLLYRNRKQY
ncbi:MAG: iron ABC transporter permease [Bacteroidales bacterium]|nr:iron ABC transporter permease [Bacteroidales bacterium]